MENVNSDLIRGNIDTIILKCLKIGDMYGLEIINHIKKASYDTYILKQPTLYSALKRLEGKGYISSYWRDSAIGGRRHYYKLTANGKESFVDKKDQWTASKDVIDTLVDGIARKTQKKQPVLPIDDAPPVPATMPQTVTMGMAINPYNPYTESENNFMTLPFRIIENAIDNINENTSEELEIVQHVLPVNAIPEKDDIPPLLKYALADATVAPINADNTSDGNAFAKYLSPDEYAAMETVKTGASAKTARITNYDIQIRPAVKHYSDRKSGDFHYITKLHLTASFMIMLAVIASLVFAYHNLKPNTSYSPDERFFFVLGYMAAGLYFIYYLVRYIASPKTKKAIQNQLAEHISRLGACLGSIIAILAINILAGLTQVNSPDFLVFWVVPCILASVIYFESIIQFLLRKTNLFVA